jgi:hypothetical protein
MKKNFSKMNFSFWNCENKKHADSDEAEAAATHNC